MGLSKYERKKFNMSINGVSTVNPVLGLQSQQSVNQVEEEQKCCRTAHSRRPNPWRFSHASVLICL